MDETSQHIVYVGFHDHSYLVRSSEFRTYPSIDNTVMAQEPESMASMTDRVERALAQWKHATIPLSKPQTSSSSSSSVTLASSRKVRKVSPDPSPSREDEHQEEVEEDDQEVVVKCRPWSHQDFVKRLNSFQILTWFAKPERIGVLECVRHGWTNCAKDQLHCNSCDAYLCFAIDERLSNEGIQAVTVKFAEQLVTGHDDNCLWRESSSPESFTMLPIASPTDVVSALEDHLEILLRDESLSQLAIDHATANGQLHKQLDQLDPLQIIQTLPKVAALCTKHKTKKKVFENALFLAVCGWNLHARHVLKCDFCNRQVGLWNFMEPQQSSSLSPSTTASLSPLAAQFGTKRRRLESEPKHGFDPIAQHRWFCPWVKAPLAEKLTGTWLDLKDLGELNANPVIRDFFQLCGWQQVVQALQLQTQKAMNLSQNLSQRNRLHTVSLTPQKALELVHEVMRGV